MGAQAERWLELRDGDEIGDGGGSVTGTGRMTAGTGMRQASGRVVENKILND